MRETSTSGAATRSVRAVGDVERTDAPSPVLVDLLATLRADVARYVEERRAEGARLERVIPEMRCLVREAESCESWRDPADTLMAQVVRWTIHAYNDQPEPTRVPRF